MITLFSFTLTYTDIAVILLVALLTGMSKTGVHGAGMITAPLMASVFGGQQSSGIVLPLLIFADIFGIAYYHRHAAWQYLRILFPWAALGVALGTFVGARIDDQLFKMIMAVTIISSISIMTWLERVKREKIPDNRLFAGGMGLAGGFTSMVGNLAGSVMAVYLLSMRLPKNVYIGTTAWFFAFINLFKVPFHVFAWHTIRWNTVMLDLLTIPVILLGAWLGIVIVKSLSEKVYRWFIIGMTVVAAVMMLT
ncbi:sulfite exporter TauE/SafE family protein [Hufsiella ginkgonis]|uniref:Probable membrane transporter protein n=1 Tax=Hufsiella ginkgonis TaxID=2695274 RepID=A0A7K1XZ77_9SPHI|nr:TSUP family transporter [Hufsiella ginkgonis]